MYQTQYAYSAIVGGRPFVLYFTVRVNADGSYKDNYVMYFLMSNVGSLGNKAITLTYTKLQYDVSVEVTDNEGNTTVIRVPKSAVLLSSPAYTVKTAFSIGIWASEVYTLALI